MKRIFKFFLIIAILLISVGCEPKVNRESLVIYTTNYAQKFILEAIGQKDVSVFSIYDTLDTYSADQDDNFNYQTFDSNGFLISSRAGLMEKVLDADLFVYNGRSSDDIAVINEIITQKESEDLPIFDATLDASRSFVEKLMALSYNNTVVDPEIKEVLATDNSAEMYWLSPIEMQNVSKEIYDKLVEILPSKREMLKQNYESLLYDLDSLYANIESISRSTTNNMIVSDNVQLNILSIHYIENVYTDHTASKLHKDDPDNELLLFDISKYMQINDELTITTTDPDSQNYFDLAVTLSPNDYKEGNGYFEIMNRNFELLRRVLAT